MYRPSLTDKTNKQKQIKSAYGIKKTNNIHKAYSLFILECQLPQQTFIPRISQRLSAWRTCRYKRCGSRTFDKESTLLVEIKQYD